MHPMAIWLLVSAASLWTAAYASAHGGGLDSSGGHHDRKNGGYHYHRSSPSASVAPLSFPRAFAPVARVAPRMTARSSARTSSPSGRYQRPAPKETDAGIAKKAVPESDPRFIFHHAETHPYQVVSFADNKEAWRALLTKGWHVRLAKDEIIRIEPVDDPKDYRSWIDATGKYSVVARYKALEDSVLHLQKFDGDAVALPLDRLSIVDRRHVQAIVEGAPAK